MFNNNLFILKVLLTIKIKKLKHKIIYGKLHKDNVEDLIIKLKSLIKLS